MASTVKDSEFPMRQVTRAQALGWACALVLLLGGCEGVKEQLGLTKSAPDEFRVQARAPLSLPPEYTLRPPAPGTARPQEGSVQDQARQAVFRRDQQTKPLNGFPPGDRRTPGERALLAAAGVDRADPDIRRVVDLETGRLNEEEQTFLDYLIFWQDTPPPGVVVNPEAEAKRLNENAALGKNATAGETPTITRRKKALFEGIF